MRILGLGKTRICGKSHSKNQKVVIVFVHDFSLMSEIKLHFQLFVYSLITRCFMIYKTYQTKPGIARRIMLNEVPIIEDMLYTTITFT